MDIGWVSPVLVAVGVVGGWLIQIRHDAKVEGKREATQEQVSEKLAAHTEEFDELRTQADQNGNRITALEVWQVGTEKRVDALERQRGFRHGGD